MEELRHFAKNDAGEPRRVVGTIIATIIVVTNIVVVIIRIVLATIIVVAITIVVDIIILVATVIVVTIIAVATVILVATLHIYGHQHTNIYRRVFDACMHTYRRTYGHEHMRTHKQMSTCGHMYTHAYLPSRGHIRSGIPRGAGAMTRSARGLTGCRATGSPRDFP